MVEFELNVEMGAVVGFELNVEMGAVVEFEVLRYIGS